MDQRNTAPSVTKGDDKENAGASSAGKSAQTQWQDQRLVSRHASPSQARRVLTQQVVVPLVHVPRQEASLLSPPLCQLAPTGAIKTPNLHIQCVQSLEEGMLVVTFTVTTIQYAGRDAKDHGERSPGQDDTASSVLCTMQQGLNTMGHVTIPITDMTTYGTLVMEVYTAGVIAAVDGNGQASSLDQQDPDRKKVQLRVDLPMPGDVIATRALRILPARLEGGQHCDEVVVKLALSLDGGELYACGDVCLGVRAEKTRIGHDFNGGGGGGGLPS